MKTLNMIFIGHLRVHITTPSIETLIKVCSGSSVMKLRCFFSKLSILKRMCVQMEARRTLKKTLEMKTFGDQKAWILFLLQGCSIKKDPKINND